NHDYQRTLDEEATRRQAPVDPPALHEDTNPDDIYFAGVAATGPSKDNLPKTLPEAFIRPDGGL
ncbi:uncharacterized protein EDB91DRAFT_1062540, partial [Suillus paluster]|uniref:uncharacterized protein n=1 Tax=Suillus paluster TaxID=48578 RepID=UPI001B8657BF